MKSLSPPKQITTQQLYLTYSYDLLAILTSLIAMGFIFYSIYLSKVLHSQPPQQLVVTLVVLNFVCIIASFLFKHKLDKQSI